MAASDDLLGQLAQQQDNSTSLLGVPTKPAASDALLDNMVGEQKRRTATVLDLVAPVNPDKAAEASALAKRFKLDPETIEKKQDDFSRMARIQDAQRLLESSPVLRMQLDDPDFAKIAHDDVENLSALESTLNFGANFGRSLATGLIPKANAGLWGAAQAVSDVGATITEPLVGTILPQNPFAVMSSKFAGFRAGQNAIADKWRGKQEGAGFIQKSVLSGAESLGMNAALIPASILSGSPSPMLAGMTTITGGDAYGQARDKSIPVVGSLAFASSQALIEYATEKIPAVMLLKDLGLRKSFGKVLANQAMAEIPGEQVATVLQDMNEWAVLNPQKPFSDYLAERPSAAAQTLIATLVATGGQVTIGKIADRAANGPREQRAVEILTALKEGALNSKTFERAPERVKAFIAKHTANGPIENLFIPAEQLAQYFQSVGIDPAAAAAEMGAKNYGEALTTGGDVVVPLADFIANVAKTEHYDALLPDIRFAQGEMTQREAELYEKNHPDEINALIEQARGMQTQNDPAVSQIESDILGQLVATGTERGTAETYAKTYAKAIANLAQRSGMDPMALHERYGLTINRPMPDILTNRIKTDINLDPFLDRMRSGDVPTDKDIFGPSLTEFIRSIGGMRDDGGELRRMEVDANNSPFMRNLIQAGGRAIDEVTALAREAGYQVDDILEAIDNEIRGNPVYASGNLDEFLLGLRDTVNQLGEYLESLGLDVAALSNEQIRQVMDEAIGSVYEQEGGDQIRQLFQRAVGYTDTKLRSDLPLSEQSYGVRYILRHEIKRLRAEAWNSENRMGDPDTEDSRITGAQLLEIITDRLGSQSEAVAYLTALGITDVIDAPASETVEFAQSLTPEQILTLFNEADTIDLQAPVQTEQEIDDEQNRFLSDAPAGTRYTRTTGLLKRVRKASEVAFAELGGSPRTARRVAQKLGPFTSYQVVGEESDNLLVVRVFGDEQLQQNLDAEPALTFTVSDSGELTVNGPLPSGDTFQQFQSLGWADLARGADGQPIPGWSSLKNPDSPDGPLPIQQLMPLLADIHARVREWRGEDYVGLYWSRATGAMGGLPWSSNENGTAVYFQGAGPRMMAVHNLSADNLVFADKMGGFAVPSIGVVTENAGGVDGFGEITLIGTKDIADPAKERVFSSDAYTARFPKPEWPKAKSKDAQALVNEIRDIASEFDDRAIIDYTWDNMVNTPDAGEVISRWLSSNAIKAKFLREQGVEAKPFVRSVAMRTPIQPKDIETLRPLVAALDQSMGADDLMASPEWKELAQEYRRLVIETYSDKGRDQAFAEKLAEFGFGTLSKLERDLENAGKSEVDSWETGKLLGEETDKRALEFKQWIEDKILPKFGDPFIKVGREKLAYTLHNIVESMTDAKVKGKEKTMTYGAGQARAASSVEFSDIEQMRAAAAESIVDPADYAESKAKTEKLLDSYRNAVVEYTTLTNWRGAPDTWEALDAAMRAIAKWSTGKKRDAAAMKAALKKEDFNVDSMPADVIEQAMEAANALLKTPVPYFEAKPQRAVTLDEFAGAAIPKNAPATVREILAKHGIEVVEYEQEDRQKVVRELAATLNENGVSTLFQDPTRLNKDMDRDTMRGYIQFGPERKFNIALLEKADLSTFLHETGHFWLEIMGDLAADPNGAQEIKDDYAKVLKFLGVESRDQIGVDQHELFARANEAYLREGKAPSPELRSIFQKFKAWLTMIYKSIEMLNVTLTDEVRGVFDRIYASDAEIEAAKNEMDVAQLFATPADAGMTDEEFAVYSKSVASSIERAKDELRSKLMRQFQREKTVWWNNELDKLRAEVTKEIDAQPVYQAFDALTKGELPDGTPFKLDKAALVEQFGKAYVKRIPRGFGEGRGAVYSTDGKGLHHDAAADLLGYGSGAELVQALVEMRPRKALIEAEANQRMVERHGDLMVDGTIADEAVAAMHNEERANLLRTELLAIRKKQIEVAPMVKVEADKAKAQRKQAVAATDTPPVSVFRDAARGMIGQQQVRDIRPYPYLLAERKASKAAFSAMAKGDYQEAAIQKQRELLNHYLYLEATAALETADDIYAYARKFTKGKTRAKFGKAGEAYLEQIDDLLDQYEFTDVSKTDLVRREKLLAFVKEKMADDEPVMIPDAVLIDAQKRNYKTLPFDQLLAVRDAIRNIEHLVDLKTRLLKVQSQRALEELVAEGAASIEEYGTKRDTPVGTRTWLDSAKELRDGYFAAHRKISSLFREMDGWKDDGFMWNTFMKPINDAANEKAVRTEDATKKLAKLYDKLQKPGLANKVKGLGLLSKEYYPSLGRSMSRADLLALALNYGNEGNRQRIRDGYGWTDQQVLAALNRLESHEWDFVQGMWDLIDSYWDEIAAQDKRVNGIAPEKVERSPIILPNGRRIEGGYYPIKYDERHSVRSYTDRAKEEAERIMRGAVARPGVDTGFTEKRAGKVIDRKIKLDLGVGLEHIDTVLQTLTHREMLIDLNRILGSTKINGAILEHYGIETYKAIQEAIVDIAAGEIGARDSVESIMGWLRSGVTVAGMGLNLSTALMQPLGVTQSMMRIGPKWVGRGIARFIGDAMHMESATKFAYEKSPMMRLRAKTMNREISEIRNKISKGGVMPKVEEAYFYAIVKMQAVVDVPTWLGAYEKYMEQTGNDEAKAIALADQAVIDAQGGGQTKDLAQIQRGGPLKKLFTTFYSYFSATWNLTVESAGRTDFKKVGDVGRFAVDMLLLYSVPVVLTAMLKEVVKGGEGPDDDDGWLAWLAREHLSFALGTLVGLREIGSAVQGMYGYSGPAGTRFFSEAGKLVTQAGQGEVDEALVKAANNTAGILFHYPAGQVQRTAEGFMALKDGSTSNPTVLIFGPRKDH